MGRIFDWSSIGMHIHIHVNWIQQPQLLPDHDNLVCADLDTKYILQLLTLSIFVLNILWDLE